MKPILTAVLVFLLYTGCEKEQKSTYDGDTKADSITKQSDKSEGKSEPDNKNPDKTLKFEIAGLSYETGILPDDIKYAGKIVAGARWEDKKGSNLLVITETPEKEHSSDSRTKELFGYHYITNGSDTKLIWKINDFIKDCPVDITLQYINKSLSITDLDNDGTAEIAFLYRMSCKGDVSPDDMKLLMYEGESKYAIRGQMELTIKGEGTYGGETKIDSSFHKAPKEFLDYAKERWSEFVSEKIGY